MKKGLLVISVFCLITSMGMQNAFGMKRLWNAISSRFIQPQVAAAASAQPEMPVPATQELQDPQAVAFQAVSQAPSKKKPKAEEPGAPATQSFSLFRLIPAPEQKHLESKETKEQLLERQKALNLSLAKIKTDLERLNSIQRVGAEQKQLILRKRMLLKQQSVQAKLLKHVTELINAFDVMTQPQFQIEASELVEVLQEQRETEQLLERAYSQIEEAKVLVKALEEIRKVEFQALQEKQPVAFAADELQSVDAEYPEILEQLSVLQQQLDAAPQQEDYAPQAQDKTDK
ncbi:MAG: hypothetical protein WCS92_05075 [Candidatus Babeliales bacterium]